MDFGQLFTKVLTLCTLAGNLAVFGLLIFYFVRKSIFNRIIDLLGAHALSVGAFLATTSTLGSLVYSEVVGFPACILCWIARLFMYPMMFIFGYALLKHERRVLPYTLGLSLLGIALSTYHWTKDMLALYSSGSSLPCPAVSFLPSCSKIYVNELGYITIPMIALNAFILIAITVYAGLKRENKL